MVDIVTNPEWKAVRILERDEVALGGYGGNMNEQATALVARTELLKEEKADRSDIVQGQYSFSTIAEFEEAKAGIPLNSTVVIDETGPNQGTNTWNGLTLVKSPYDPLEQSKAYTNTLVSIINDAWVADLASVEVDADGDIISYVKTDGSRFDENTTAKEAFAAYLESRFSEFTDNWAPNWLVSVEIDSDGDVISYVKNNGKTGLMRPHKQYLLNQGHPYQLKNLFKVFLMLNQSLKHCLKQSL